MSYLRLSCIALVLLLACGDDDELPLDTGPDASDAADASDSSGDASDASEDTGPVCEFTEEAEELPDPRRYTPRWAFEPWISKDISDREDTEAFVAGFLDRNIPVGAVVLDSPWETQYNTFIPNPDRYGDFQTLVDDLHSQDIRLVLWITQMVNSLSFDLEEGGDGYRGAASNFVEGRECDFYVSGGRLFPWWKGSGAAVDFFNPRAVAWWRRQQDDLLEMGIDGWKLDFGESYLRERDDSDAILETFDGIKSMEEYSEAYYADFLRYGVQQNGDQFVTMVRGFDVSYDHRPRFYARPEHAPVVWMGDNHRDWVGLVDALDHSFRSADAGYVVIGSDIGGYLDRDENDVIGMPIPFDQEVFARWVAWSGMMPFFQLHGRANLEPWNIEARTEETVDLYRYWATLHHEMVPFWYSLAQQAYLEDDASVMMQTIGEEADWADDWRYFIGDAFLVAPILEAGGIRDVEIPEGTFFDWWSGDTITGPTTLEAYAGATDRSRIPIFVREGAIIPMEIDSDVTGIGRDEFADHVTILAWLPTFGTSEFFFYREDDARSRRPLTARRDGFTAAAGEESLILRLRPRDDLEVGQVRVEDTLTTEHDTRAEFDAASTGWFLEDEYVWVKLEPADDDQTIVLESIPVE